LSGEVVGQPLQVDLLCAAGREHDPQMIRDDLSPDGVRKEMMIRRIISA